MKKIYLLLLVVVALLVLHACTKSQESTTAKPARVAATKAYEKYFGPAPTSDKGTCYAFVIYFPSAKETGKVVAFPFFSFDEKSMKKVAVERLLAGMEIPAYNYEIFQPFAPGARLLELAQADGLWKVDLSRDFLAPGENRVGMLNALVMTLTQFEGVRGIRVLEDGKELDYARGPLLPDSSMVIDPSPPRILSITAVKEKGAKNVADVNAYFDRPVEIQELRMTDLNGKPFEGEIFQSVFDMAAVLKPKDPSIFKSQMPIRVHWKAMDKRGRQGEGDKVWHLEIRED